MSEKSPIEIRPEDIIKRPENLPVKTGSPGTTTPPGKNPLANMKEYMKEAKEMVQMAQEMGLGDMLGNLGLNLPGKDQAPQGNKDQGQKPANQVNQYQLFVRLLIQQYGNITVDELLVKLKEDYGNKNLDQFIKGIS